MEDCWHINYNKAPLDGRPWLEENGDNCDSRVLRGGSWYNFPVYARSAYRNGHDPYFSNYNLGFRVLCSSPIR